MYRLPSTSSWPRYWTIRGCLSSLHISISLASCSLNLTSLASAVLIWTSFTAMTCPVFWTKAWKTMPIDPRPMVSPRTHFIPLPPVTVASALIVWSRLWDFHRSVASEAPGTAVKAVMPVRPRVQAKFRVCARFASGMSSSHCSFSSIRHIAGIGGDLGGKRSVSGSASSAEEDVGEAVAPRSPMPQAGTSRLKPSDKGGMLGGTAGPAMTPTPPRFGLTEAGLGVSTP
mmetsp:Transcript_11888/g.24033  ORF Transcript_11888/g.24033 Transcript_11888/m.24033 type:complete len:229 (-) Transcript_11888:5-691(-)